jgi:hypothetical protein
MWEISEGDTKFLYAIKLATPKDLGSIIHPDSTTLKILLIATLFIESIGTWHYFIYFVFFFTLQTP